MEGAVHEEVHTPEVSALYPITCWYWVGFFFFLDMIISNPLISFPIPVLGRE